MGVEVARNETGSNCTFDVRMSLIIRIIITTNSNNRRERARLRASAGARRKGPLPFIYMEQFTIVPTVTPPGDRYFRYLLLSTGIGRIRKIGRKI
jgi:hypothetical protein